MKRWLIVLAGLITIIVMVAGCAGAPEAVITPEEFYRGKIITIVVPFAPGGGFDTDARVIAPYLAKQLGAKMAVVDNETGGAGWGGINFLFASAPKDGLTIGCIPGDRICLNEIFELGQPVAFKSVKEFSVIAMLYPDSASITCVTPGSRFNTLKDLVGAESLKCPESSPFASNTLSWAPLASCFGIKNLKIICGYAGTADRQTACFRGEVDIISVAASAPGMLQSGMLKPIGFNDTNPTRSRECFPEYAYLPSFSEVALPGTIWEKEFAEHVGDTLRTVAAPPAIPQDRLDFLVESMRTICQDPAFIKECEKRMVDIAPTDPRTIFGKDVAAFFGSFLDMPRSQRMEIKDRWDALFVY